MLIWEFSLLLAGSALALMLLLISLRLLADRRTRRREVQRQVLVPALLGVGELDESLATTISPAVMADVSINLIQMVRGAEREAFADRATQLGVPLRLAKLLRSGSTRRRLAAAQAMGAFHDEGSLTALRGALDDRNGDVRLAAALSLAAAGDTRGAAMILPTLARGEREPSLLILSLLKSIAADRPGEVKALMISAHSHPLAKVAALEALVATGDYTLVPLIADLALGARNDAEELPRYLLALGQLGHPAARAAVIDGLARPSTAVRAAAATAAGRIGLLETADTLRMLLDDPEWWVRFRAAEALLDLGEKGRSLLHEAARTGDPRARDAARTMLAERGREP